MTVNDSVDFLNGSRYNDSMKSDPHQTLTGNKLTVSQALALIKRGNLTPEEKMAISHLLTKHEQRAPSATRHGEVKVIFQASPEQLQKLLPWCDPHDPPPTPPRDQRAALSKCWQSRSSFVKCKHCGGRDTYKSIDVTFTKNRIWCYTCGAYDLRVTLEPEVYEMLVEMVKKKGRK